MSASREKKKRQQAEGLTEKERRQAQSAQKTKVRRTAYIIAGVIVALLVAALLVWNTGFFQKRASAVSVGDENYTVGDLSYYYHLIANQTASTASSYAQYGIDMGYDPSLSPADQMYDEDTTYEEYFRQTAVDNLQSVAVLCAEAEKAGYTLSEDGQASVDDVVAQIEQYSAQYGYSKQAYLKLLYGPYITESVFLRHLAMSMLASEYQAYYTDSFSYTDDDLEAYYGENASRMDSYHYRYCFISGAVETADDESGSEAEPTEEERTAAMEAARAGAEEMVTRYRAGEGFNALAAEYVQEASAEYYSDPEYNHITGKLGSEVSSYAYGSWLMDDARTAGEAGVVESEGSGYYVVALLGRERSENTYESVDVRHILVKAEADAAEDGGDALPTEEQLAAAYAEAQRLLEEWQAGAATSESFAQLANLNSDDPGSNANGGLYEDVARGTMISSFNDWIFAPGRSAGDTGIVVNTDGKTDDVRGYHVMYFEAAGQVRWKYQAKSALSAADFETWFEGVKEAYPVVTKGALSLVG